MHMIVTILQDTWTFVAWIDWQTSFVLAALVARRRRCCWRLVALPGLQGREPTA